MISTRLVNIKVMLKCTIFMGNWIPVGFVAWQLKNLAVTDKIHYEVTYLTTKKKNMLQKMKVSNQQEYNKFLQEKENIFHYIDEAIENWYDSNPKVQGSDKVVILVHIIANLFRIGLRQTVGFIQEYLQQIGKNLAVISYSQASRRFNKLNIEINDCRADKSNMGDIEIAIDSTSISIYNNTPGHICLTGMLLLG